jgi:Carboxypeptidase regulatory-like domain
MNREASFSHFLSFRVAACMLTLLFLLTAATRSVFAQGTLQNASLFGTVTDSSGAAMAGVTVTVTGTSLQGTETATTDADGNYRITELPPGVYKIVYSMSGFQSEVRSDFELTSGFNARVDVPLKVGATSQTVEVTGQAPVVDTATTSALGEVSQTTLVAVPSSRSLGDAVFLIPGVRPSTTPDIGGSQLGQQASVGSYGFGGNVITLEEGVDVMQENGSEYGGPIGTGTGQLLDYDMLADLTVITTGAQADIGEAGPVIIATMKSGSNSFHGDSHFFYEPHWFQATDLPANGPGLGSGANQLQYFYDAQADLGGRIIRDKLWFWGGYHLERDSSAVFGYIGPGGGQGYNPTHQDDNEAKVSYQASKTVEIVGDYTFESKVDPQYEGSPSIPYGSTINYFTGFWSSKGEVIWTPNARWLVDILGGYKWQHYDYPNQANVDVSGNPYEVNQTTGITSGAAFNTGSNDGGSHDRVVFTGTVSYFPSGKHQFQFGEEMFLPEKDKKYAFDHPAGNYEAIVKNATAPATGVVPYELTTYSFPIFVEAKENAIGEYFKDTWRATSRLTVNYGGRFDYYEVYNDKSVAPAGQFSLGATFPPVTVGSWKRVAPRIGVAYDLKGDGKTVIRASYGTYNIPWVSNFDNTYYNPASVETATYSWAGDTCQATTFENCVPSAAFLNAITASLANPTQATFNGKNIYISSSVPSLAIINPNLKMPDIQQASVQLARELTPNIGITAIYVYQREDDMYNEVFPDRPLSAYTVPYNTVYPSTDPVNGGKPLTVYTYPSSYSTANQYEIENRTTGPDFYHALTFSITKRQGKRWGAGASLNLIRDHRYLEGGPFTGGEDASGPAAPYQEAFPLDYTWDETVTSYIVTRLPYNLTFGLTYDFLAGTPNYTTDQITGVPFLGTVTIPVNQFGSDRTPGQNVLNLKFGRIFPIKEHDSLEVSMEIFNTLNAAPGETVNYINGSGTKAFGYVSAVMPPLIGRFGATFKF